MNRTLMIALCGLVAAGWVTAPLSAQEKKKPDAKVETPASAKPGPEHQQLAKLAGEYTTETKVVTVAGTTPVITTGTGTCTSILGGRVLRMESTGTLFGQPIQGMALIGYNNASQKYEGIMTHSQDTAMMTLTGMTKDGGKTMRGTAVIEGPKGAKQNLETGFRIIDDDHFVSELSAKSPDGGKGITIETTCTRKK